MKIPEIDIKISSIPIQPQTRKLRAKWSLELPQDLGAYRGMGEPISEYDMSNYLYDPTIRTAIGEPLALSEEDYNYATEMDNQK